MRVITLALIAAGIVLGCSSAGPLATAKLSQAERAVDEAHNASAGTNAAGELRTAMDRLRDAQAAFASGDYDRAMRLADMASVDADYARARSVNQRVTTSVGEMRQNINILREELDRLPQ